MTPLKLSPYKQHVARWGGCTKCSLSETRNKMCFGRGTVPCDVLFIGEAPGRSEDSIGQPFVGPAGHLLDRIIEEALMPWHPPPEGVLPITVAFTNLLACIPIGGEEGEKMTQPDPADVIACSPRLIEFVKIAKPKLIVCVGDYAERWVPKLVDPLAITMIHIDHPARILRSNFAQQSMMYRRAVVTLRSAVEEIQ